MANKRELLEKQYKLLREVQIRKARASFWEFCKTIAPDFYKESRPHLKVFCKLLQDMYEKKVINEKTGKPYTKLMINMPPRLGKSRTLQMFCIWCYGIDASNRIIACSYNQRIVTKFSRNVRNGLITSKGLPHEIDYHDIFPNTSIQDGNASVMEFSIENQFNSFTATSIGGTLTGTGGNIFIIDDPVKDAYEAFNENRLQDIWEWYTGTTLSRMEGSNEDSRALMQIINMTRWSKGDMCGRILSDEVEAQEWYVFVMKAYDEQTNTYLCEELLPASKYKELERNVDTAIFKANYLQEPVSMEGRLYKQILTYEKLVEFEEILAYVDTADTGSDYWAMVVGGRTKQKDLYILDIYFTKDDSTITEKETARKLIEIQKQYDMPVKCTIESNSAGGVIARNIERIIKEEYQNKKVSIQKLHQSKNKHARIISHASVIQEHVLFPVNWKGKYKEFYAHITDFQKDEKANPHDDGADALTGLVEIMDKVGTVKAVMRI
jgi:predicted phage terminase large subunit-like protein